MKPFNLKEYLANPTKKLITRDGRSVRIICTDAKYYDYPIIALISLKGDIEVVCTYTEKGTRFNIQDNDDLFFATEKKEGWQNIYKSEDGNMIGSIIWPTKEEAERNANTSPTSLIKLVVTIKVEWEECL